MWGPGWSPPSLGAIFTQSAGACSRPRGTCAPFSNGAHGCQRIRSRTSDRLAGDRRPAPRSADPGTAHPWIDRNTRRDVRRCRRSTRAHARFKPVSRARYGRNLRVATVPHICCIHPPRNADLTVRCARRLQTFLSTCWWFGNSWSGGTAVRMRFRVRGGSASTRDFAVMRPSRSLLAEDFRS